MMGREQCVAYKDAIDEYRAASRARFTKSLAGSASNSVNFLPKRQISNYFTQFRKVMILLYNIASHGSVSCITFRYCFDCYGHRKKKCVVMPVDINSI